MSNGDVIAYAKALQLLSEDNGLAKEYGTNARKRVQDLFLYDAFVDKIKELVIGN